MANYGELVGPGAKFRTVVDYTAELYDSSAIVYHRVYVEVYGEFNGTTVHNNYGYGDFSLGNSSGVYGDSGWVSVGEKSYGSTVTDGPEVWYTSGSGTKYKSAAAGSYTVPYNSSINPPSNLSYTRITDNRVNLTWTASSSYKTAVLVERQTDGGQWAKIASLSESATSYADTTTSADHTYKYRIRVTNSQYYSDYATSATVITMAPAAPTAITLARATGTDVAVTLVNNTNTATSLEWWKQAQGSTDWVLVGTEQGKVTSFIATGLEGVYKIRVKNVNAIGSSAWLESEYITTICAPNPPTLLEPIGVFNMSNGTIAFKWLHNTIDGSAQTAAKLQYKVNSGSWSDEISVTTAQEYSIAASTFNAGDKITWRVKTKGAYEDPQHEPPIDGYSSYSSEKSFNVYQVPSLSFVPNKPPSPSDNPPYVTQIPIPCEVTYSDPQSMACASATVSLYDGNTLMFSEPMGINGNTLTASLTADEFVPENGKTYTVVVTARSGSTLQATVSTTFTVSYTEPKRATVQISNDADTGHVTLLVAPQGDTAATGNPAIIGGVYSNWHLRSVEFNGSCEVSDGQVVTTCGAGSGSGANLSWPAVDVEVAGADTPTLYHDALKRTYAAGINSVNDTVSLSTTASTITRRIGCVDLGSFTWVYDQGATPRFHTTGIQSLVRIPSVSGTVSNLLCAIYTAAGSYTDDMTMYVDTSGILSINNSGYQTAAAFKTAMSGKLLYYELAQSQTINLTERLADGVSIEAEGGGTVAFENSHGATYRIPVPNESFFKVQGAEWSAESGASQAYSQAVPANGKAFEFGRIGGRTVVWNQLAKNVSITSKGVTITGNQDNSITLNGTATESVYPTVFKNTDYTFISGHKYFMYAESNEEVLSNIIYIPSASIGTTTNILGGAIVTATNNGAVNANLRLVSGTSYTATIKACVIDLTRMFGAGNEPATVEAFKAMFPADYYAYDAGSLLNADVVNVKSVGKNIWDEQWEVGDYSRTTGEKHNNVNRLRSKNLIPVLPSTQYYFVSDVGKTSYSSWYDACFYSENGVFLSNVSPNVNRAFTTPQNAYKMSFSTSDSWGSGHQYAGGFAIVKGSSGAYTPYKTHNFEITQAIRNACPLYGASAGSAHNFIDFERRKYVQNVASVDLGTLTWTRYDTGSSQYIFYGDITGGKTAVVGTSDNILCAAYSLASQNVVLASAVYASGNKRIGSNSNTSQGTRRIIIRDDSYTDAAAFKTAMSGVMLYYELATPVEVDLSTMLPAKSALPQPTASVSLESALPTSITATAGYDGPDYTSIQVYRVSDHRQLLMDGAVAGQSLIDRYAPLNTEYTYEVITRATSGAIAVNSISAMFKSDHFFFLFGEDFAKGKWNQTEQINMTKPHEEFLYFSGRELPVSVDDESESETRTLGFSIVSEEEAKSFKRLMGTDKPIIYKSIRGDVFKASTSVNITPVYNNRSYYGDCSISLTKTDGDDL